MPTCWRTPAADPKELGVLLQRPAHGGDDLVELPFDLGPHLLDELVQGTTNVLSGAPKRALNTSGLLFDPADHRPADSDAAFQRLRHRFELRLIPDGSDDFGDRRFPYGHMPDD